MLTILCSLACTYSHFILFIYIHINRSTFLGAVAAFILGPMITVDDANNDPESQKKRIMVLFYVEALIVLFTLICAFAYFPDKPEFPPSISAALKQEKREKDKDASAKALLLIRSNDNDNSTKYDTFAAPNQAAANWFTFFTSNKMVRFLYLNVAISLPLGLYQGWSSVLDLNLQEFGITTIQSAWIGCWMTLSGCLGSIVIARYTDRFVGKLKTCCVIALVIASFFLFLFIVLLNSSSLSSTQNGGVRIVLLYVTIICTGFFTNISIPLQYELLAENVFGMMSESMAIAICTITNTILQIIFLALPTKINGSSIWMNWTSLFSIIISVLMIIIYKVDYTRLMLDTAASKEQQPTLHEVEYGKLQDNQEQEGENGTNVLVDGAKTAPIGFWFDRFGFV
jgi:hypothetical protein